MNFLKDDLAAETVICSKNNNLYMSRSRLCTDGIFSFTGLKKGEIIECCPLILFTEKELDFLKYTNLYNYYSYKVKENAGGLLALGFGAIYNHSSPSNAQYKLDLDKKTMTITSVCIIEANVEITINYNGKYDDSTAVVLMPKDEVYEFSVNLL